MYLRSKSRPKISKISHFSSVNYRFYSREKLEVSYMVVLSY